MSTYESNGYVAKTLREILQSKQFNTESFRARRFKLSEAYCLLWHDQQTGDVAERQQASSLLVNMEAAAVILDLVALGKIQVNNESKSLLGIKYNKHYVQVRRNCQANVDELFISSLRLST